MKNYIYTIIILLSLSINICGQGKNLQGTWISRDNDVVIIKEIGNRFNILSTIQNEEQLKLKIAGDTLNFYTEYTKLGSEKIDSEEYKFYIKELTKDRLVLVPTSILSREFFEGKKKLVFIKQEYNLDKSFSFEKLIYHTTECYGSCSIINLELDKNKNLYVKRKLFNNESMSGNYEGKLSDEQFDRLINILQTSNLKTWSFPEKDGHDGPVITLIIYYNGKRQYLKSMFPPTISQQLIDFLYNIGEGIKLEKTDNKRVLEY